MKTIMDVCRKYFMVLLILLFFLAAAVTAQSGTSRCFQFTWLGPRWNNESVFMNATCQDATRLANGVPCELPLVVSYDGTWPDVEYIWRHYSQNASCILADNDVCAQYTYYFNEHAENSTYMCTRAVDTSGSAITSGCYEERRGTFLTRVCFCRSVPGGVPCNSGTVASISSILVVVVFIIMSLTNILPVLSSTV